MSIFDRFAKVLFGRYVHGYVMCWGVTDLVKQAGSIRNDVMCAYGVLYMRDIFRRYTYEYVCVLGSRIQCNKHITYYTCNVNGLSFTKVSKK